MSSAMPVFDTHKYINTLKAAGFTEAQAEAQSSALVGAFDANAERLATKEDLRVLGAELRGDLAEFRSEMRAEFAEFRGEIRTELAEFRGELAGFHGELADVRGDMRGMRGEIDQIRGMLRWMAGPSLIGTMATAAGMVALMIKNFA